VDTIEQLNGYYVRRAQGEEPVVYPDGPGKQGYVLTSSTETRLRRGSDGRGGLGILCLLVYALFPIVVELPLVLLEEIVPLELSRASTPLHLLGIITGLWWLCSPGYGARAALKGAQPSSIPLRHAEVHHLTAPEASRFGWGILSAAVLPLPLFFVFLLPLAGKIVVGSLLALVLVPYTAGVVVRTVRRRGAAQ
jgi:hypothetical protein